MARIKEMTVEDLEQLIEAKVLEMAGDPDSGLKLKPGFKRRLKDRLKKISPKVSHQEVLKKFG